MEEARRPVANPGGYLLVLLGAVAFVGSCFLPYYDAGGQVPSSIGDPSLFDLLTFFRATSLAGVGGVLTLFGGTATISGIALIGLRSYRSWTPAALLATSVAWSFTWIGTFLNGTDIFAPHAIGYWAMILSVIIVVAGSIMVWTSSRRTSPGALPAADAVDSTQPHAR
jgi:hypothetical protein